MSDLRVTSSLPGAKRRARRRRASAGGTMFVVAMTLAVLSTIGAWALQSAALEVRMAGYERQSMQTHYLAEYGVMAAIQDVPASDTGRSVIVASECGVNGVHASCTSVPCLNFPGGAGAVSVMAGAGCSEILSVTHPAQGCFTWISTTAFGGGFTPATTANLLDVTDAGVSGAPGSLGATSTTGTIRAELTDVTTAPQPPGFSGAWCDTNQSSSMCSYWVAATAFGQTSNGSTAGQGSEQLRTRLLVGPVKTINFDKCQ